MSSVTRSASSSHPKILFIASLESDYLQDSVYAGLCEILGADRVFEYSFNFYKHFNYRQYPRNLGFVKTESLSRLVRQRFFPDEISTYDAVIVGSTKPETFEIYRDLQKKIANHTQIIFLDGGDRPEIGGDLIRLSRPDLYKQVTQARPFDHIFKREYLISDSHPANVTPLPFGINPLHFPKSNFGLSSEDMPWLHDVTFWAVESDPIRTRALTLIEDHFDCRQNGTERNQTFRKYKRKGQTYLEELRRSKITLNFRGVGWDTLRYWEVTGLNRFLISQKPQIVIPNNFREGQEIIYCQDSLSDLIDLCQHYLQNETAREKIAAAAGEWFLRYHTHRCRAETVLKILG